MDPINAAQATALSGYRNKRSIGCRNTIYRENDRKVPIGCVFGNLGHNLIESGATGSYADIEKVGGRHEGATNGDANAARHAGNLAGYFARLKRGVRWAKTGHKETDELSRLSRSHSREQAGRSGQIRAPAVQCGDGILAIRVVNEIEERRRDICDTDSLGRAALLAARTRE